ncbi:MAG TPA: phosphatase PAP2 family protein [Vicinamibacteria bacterium]|nr:phosphatase PAP2 family protein [Vicinamibacteria bacterium]
MNVLALVNDSDLRISDRVWAWRPPRFFRAWMLWASRLGDGWLWAGIGLVLLAAGGPGRRVLAGGALAAFASNALLLPLKRRFRRRRPCESGLHPLYDVRPLARFAADRYSFPSGHALNAFAIATVVGLGLPGLSPLLLVLAASVAASRVLCGLHYVSDVLVGALVGAGIGTAVFVLVLR